VKLWRSLRAYPAFKTALIPYKRPCRAFGHSTNSNRRLLLWSFRFIFSTPNYIAILYIIFGILGFMILGGSLYFAAAWLILGIGLLVALLNLLYIAHFNYPSYSTDELIKKQLLVRFPGEDHAHH
jgi:hypothetical protein